MCYWYNFSSGDATTVHFSAPALPKQARTNKTRQAKRRIYMGMGYMGLINFNYHIYFQFIFHA